MDATPRPRGPSGSALLAGTPEAEAYCRSLAPAVFPDGVAWLTRANQAPVFLGRRPLDRMLDGRMEDLMETLSYLKTATLGLL